MISRAILLFLLAMLIHSTVMAGARGYVAVMMDIGDQDFFESETYRKNLDGDFAPNSKLQDCWNRQATGGERLDWTIRKKIPDGLTTELARAVWNGDKSASQKVQSILKKSKSPDGRHEVDGIFIVKASEGKITVMALGSRGPLSENNPSSKITFPWNEKNPSTSAADFDMALCSVSRPLGFGFGP